jgi:V/A-type H+-transporting ATPase subunit I
MGVARLAKVTMVVPRSELNLTLKELAEFEWFHPSQPETLTPDPMIDTLNSKAYKRFLELDEIVKELNIRLQPGLIETILKGYKVEKEKFTVSDWADFTAQIEAEAKPIVQEFRHLLDELGAIRKSLSEDRVLQATLLMLSKFSIDLKELGELKRFYIIFTVTSSKDVREIQRSLIEQIVLEEPLTKSESALLVVAPKSEFDRIEKVLRSFELKPFTIPEKLPQNPAGAYRVVEENIKDLEAKMSEANKALESASQKTQQKLLSLKEAAYSAYVVLNQMRKSGDLKRFATIQGYIPADKIEEFKTKQSHRFSFTEETEHSSSIPTLLRNSGPSKDFQNITLTQGPPKYGEFDPTPILTLVFPIFYGMMFADFGQGLVLLILGLALRIRGDPSMKQWGTIFTAAGIAATVFGFIVGEVFGFEIGGLGIIGAEFQSLGFPILNVAVKEGKINQDSILLVLKAGILIGVVHIALGLVLDTAKGLKEKDWLELYTLKIPSIIMYVFGVLFSLSFTAMKSYDLQSILKHVNNGPVPIISLIAPELPAYFVARVSLVVAGAAILVIIFGKAIAGFLGKYKGENPAMSIILGLVEFLLKLVEFLANTISYTRLGILLLVHVSLMYLVTYASGGLIGLPIAIIWNIAVMMIEGLIVYIQSLRLHIYEWFTKFYEGTGTLFQKILPETRYVEISWKRPKPVSQASA